MNAAFLLSLPVTLVAIGAIITGVIFGLLWFMGIFDRVKREKSNEASMLDDRVVGLLKDQVDALEKKVNAQELIINATASKIHALETRNKIIEDIFQGRDATTIEFQKQGFELMKLVPMMMQRVERTDDNLQSLIQVLEKFMNTINIQTTPTTVTTTVTQ